MISFLKKTLNVKQVNVILDLQNLYQQRVFKIFFVEEQLHSYIFWFVSVSHCRDQFPTVFLLELRKWDAKMFICHQL